MEMVFEAWKLDKYWPSYRTFILGQKLDKNWEIVGQKLGASGTTMYTLHCTSASVQLLHCNTNRLENQIYL